MNQDTSQSHGIVEHNRNDALLRKRTFAKVGSLSYLAYAPTSPSPSALPMRAAAVRYYLGKFDRISSCRLFDVVKAEYDRNFKMFKHAHDAKLKIYPKKVRHSVEHKTLINNLHRAGELDHANEMHRQVYDTLGIMEPVRNVEEVTTAYTALLETRLDLGASETFQLVISRYVSTAEVESILLNKTLFHKDSDQDFLSFSLPERTDCPVHPDARIDIVVTDKIRNLLRVVNYRSALFSAPGSKPERTEWWKDVKAWSEAKEFEVRLHVPVEISKLEITIHPITMSKATISRLRRTYPHASDILVSD